jgi:8-hydroxy-5-deazaflavin:NADPH oxidoreductase
MSEKPVIAIIGGTGDLGSGLAQRWAKAGYPVVIGSRDAAKAESAAKEMGGGISGSDNAGAAKAGDVVVLSVPFSNHDATLTQIREAVQGKIVIDAVVPLVPPKVSVAQPPAEGSAAKLAAKALGEGVKVVSAFHNVGASKLRGDGPIECDVLVFGDDRATRDQVIALIDAIGLRGVDGGVLANSIVAECMTSVLIGINRRYKIDGAGIRITGLPQAG